MSSDPKTMDRVVVEYPHGFAMLHKPGYISKGFDSGAVCTVQIDHIPNTHEVMRTVKQLDRTHAFYCGQAVGLLYSLRAQFRREGLAELNPEAFVKWLRLQLAELDSDTQRFALVQHIEPEQLNLTFDVQERIIR